ncbi:hypothetical protein [Mycolicibacterium mageritense]|uniref:hypothetical protein n=1 Tax=Mycolicibacterium mageritense TaxID=53462 RepID=UPI0010390F54|nr:hypothetical protein [Mycolicibacterium mageritense]MCC9180087.1 hypothetical protein [Mycolicibacterium mageritense]TXI65830.1 MAG: hypothetical protein E6Q55_00980 [Mycolicibacterium mageritense]
MLGTDFAWRPVHLDNSWLIDALAAYEVGRLNAAEHIEDRDAVVQQLVIGQVVFGQLLLTLRPIEHEYHCALILLDEPSVSTQDRLTQRAAHAGGVCSESKGSAAFPETTILVLAPFPGFGQ